MTNQPRTASCLRAAQSYFKAEFPGQVTAVSETGITVFNDDISHLVVFQPEFLQKCSDYAYALRDSELADYIRETRPQGRRFLVVWHEGGTRVRSVPG